MIDSSRLWAHDGVLARLGARLVAATPESADETIAAAVEELLGELGAQHSLICVVDHHTRRARTLRRWADGARADDDPPMAFDPAPAFVQRFQRGAGVELAVIEEMLPPGTPAGHGWIGGAAVVAQIDRTDDETTILVVAGPHRRWETAEVDLVRALTTLLRQFNARVRVERRLVYQLALEDVIATVSARLLVAAPDEIDDAVDTIMADLRDVLGVEAVSLIDQVADDTIEITHTVGPHELPEMFRRVEVPDMSAIPGAEGGDLATFIGAPRILDIVALVEALAGPEVVEQFGLREPARTLAFLPASVQATNRAALAITRVGSPFDWLAEEFDALGTIASLIAQARARVAAERDAAFRHAAQTAFADVAAASFRLGGDESLAAALRRIAEGLGAVSTSIVRVDPESRRLVREDGASPWAEAEADRFRQLSAEELALLDRGDELIIEGPRGFGLLVPVREEGDRLVVVGAGWLGSLPVALATAVDMVRAAADLIDQLRVRARAERAIARRLEIDEVLAQIADDLLGATAADHDRAVTTALRRLSELLDLVGATISRVEEDGSVIEVAHAPMGGLHVGERASGRLPYVTERLLAGETVQLIDPPTDWTAYLEGTWGVAGTVSFWPVQVGGETVAYLAAMSRDTGEWLPTEFDAMRTFAAMLGQLRARVEAQRAGERQLAAQRVLGECAVELAEARTDDLTETIGAVLDRVRAFVEVDGLGTWLVDRHARRYVLRAGTAGVDAAGAPLPDEVPFGAVGALDSTRRSGLRSVAEIAPATGAPIGYVAVPRGDGRADSVVLATSAVPGPWRADTVQTIEALSHAIHQVETRVAAERYADAAFAAAPIGVVLRDSELRLVTCNRAFADFVGVDSVEDLVGTMPAEVYDDPYEEVVWDNQDGMLVGEAAFRRRNGGRVWGQMRGTVIDGVRDGESLWLVHVEDITESRRAEQLLRFQASHDELTGLANRRQLLDGIRGVVADGRSVAVLLLDLDRFKLINDSLGHDRGDELLVVVADRLRLAVRPGDLVARLGGDEFAVVLPGPVSVTEAEFVADRLLDLIGEPIVLGSQEVFPTVSVGIAVADDDVAVSDLLRRADTAMYRAKSMGRARHEAFDEQLRDEVMARMATEAGLRGALRSGEFCVHYQPEVSLVTGDVLAVEALVRWDHPVQGLLTAARFIDIAEETGLVVDIGEFVLTEACREAVTWPGGKTAPQLRVNFSAAQLQRDETIGLVRAALAASGLPAHRLCLEITESAVMSDLERSAEILDRLKEMGVELAVDDFGTGFSSLAYLKQFPVDVLKIDRAFVSGLGSDDDDTAFVRSIISLAEALGLVVVAEGVETATQSSALLDLGCERAQGYLFAAPAPATVLQDFMASRR